MPVTATPIFIQKPTNGKVTITGTATTGTLYTGGSNGSKIVGIVATSNEASLARNMSISITRSAVNYLLGTATIPAGAGTIGTTPPVNVISPNNIPGLPIDADGNPYILLLDASDSITIQMDAVTSAKVITAVAIGGDF